MMHFLDVEADGALAAELKDAGLLAPDVVERIEAALHRPETGTMNEFLLAGADWIPERAWLSWLIRRHGCHRFGSVGGSPATGEPRGAVPADGNLPCRRCGDGSIVVAVLRPDRMAETARRWPRTAVLRAAASLREIRALHEAWARGACRDLT